MKNTTKQHAETRGRVSVFHLYRNGHYIGRLTETAPRLFDFVSGWRNQYSFPFNLTREEWLGIGAADSELTELEYTEPPFLWCVTDSEERAQQIAERLFRYLHPDKLTA